MNQRSRQKATSPMERDFYNLLNIAIFGMNTRNNISNCHLNLFMMKLVKLPTSNNLILYLTMIS